MGTAPFEERVRLRPLAERDANRIAEIFSHSPDIAHWVMRLGHPDEIGAAAWVEERLAEERDGRRVTRAITLNGDDELVGAIWLGRFDKEAKRGELAYWTATAARNKGVATTAVRMMATFAFDELELVRVQILAAVDNLASRRVAERAGFTNEGTLRSYRRIQGEHTDLAMYSLLVDRDA